MECTHHIFILFKIHTGFSTHTAVYLCQKRCRNLNKINTAQIGSCRISGKISGYTAAKSCQDIFSRIVMLNQKRIQILYRIQVLGRFSCRESIKIHRHVQAFQGFLYFFSVQSGNGIICNDTDLSAGQIQRLYRVCQFCKVFFPEDLIVKFCLCAFSVYA
ncbi:unknown [Roseburia sp. CAG:471]|nr:unknown [Roseburia sp. CAG:471]